MREICTSGSEGGLKSISPPYPYLYWNTFIKHASAARPLARSITTQIRISLVLIICTLISDSAKARNIFSPTPVWLLKPTPVIEIFAMFGSDEIFVPGH